MIRGHPLFFTIAVPNGKAVVHWYTCRDLSCPGKAYYDGTPRCRGALTAKVRQLEQDGQPSAYCGHRLDQPFEKIFQFWLPQHRFWAFRGSASRWFITNGNIKDDKHQERDYRIAEDCRKEFFSDPDTLPYRRDQ